MALDITAQLPQLEAMCQALYNSQASPTFDGRPLAARALACPGLDQQNRACTARSACLAGGLRQEGGGPCRAGGALPAGERERGAGAPSAAAARRTPRSARRRSRCSRYLACPPSMWRTARCVAPEAGFFISFSDLAPVGYGPPWLEPDFGAGGLQFGSSFWRRRPSNLAPACGIKRERSLWCLVRACMPQGTAQEPQALHSDQKL